MVAPLVILGGILVILAAIALFLYWTSSIREEANACLTSVDKIIKQINNIHDNPDSASIWCAAAKTSMKNVEKQCPDFGIPQYAAIVPPCPP